MFAWLIIILGILACVHFVYEGIIVPSWRRGLRYRLFALRDDLRDVMADKDSDLDVEAFGFLQDSMNTSLGLLRRIDIRVLCEARRKFDDDPDLLRRIARREEKLRHYDHEEFQRIRRQSIRVFATAFVVNSMGFILMLWPVWITMMAAHQFKRVWNFFKKIMLRITYTPENEAHRYFNDNMMHPA